MPARQPDPTPCQPTARVAPNRLSSASGRNVRVAANAYVPASRFATSRGKTVDWHLWFRGLPLNLLCLDLEGVLVPEIWQAVARHTGIEALGKTTRDIPVYDDLMRMRLGVLARQGVKLSTIQDVIGGLDPLPGALDFLAWARQRFQVAVLSDTFYEFGMPLMAKLGHPLLLCHRLTVAEDRIIDYRLRQEDPKRQAVRAFRAMRYRVLAAGDSFNDVSMLDEADAGVFFNAPANVLEQHPGFAATSSYAELASALERAAHEQVQQAQEEQP